MSVRRKGISVSSKAWLPVFPQLTKLQKEVEEVAYFCHRLLPILFSTLQEGSFTSGQSSMLFAEEDKSNCFYFISPGFVGVLFGGLVCLFVFKVKLESSLTVAVGLRRTKHHLCAFENSRSAVLLLCNDQKEERSKSSGSRK